MLYANSGSAPRHPLETGHDNHKAMEKSVWLDLVEANGDERALAERASGLRVPSRSELEEIESSSRLSAHDGVLTMSMPLIFRAADRPPTVSPIGFVLSRERLLTVRFAEMPVFDRFAEQFATADGGAASSIKAFVGLLEAIVDRLADVLEQTGARLEEISGEVFHADDSKRGRNRWDAELQLDLRGVGRMGQFVGKVHQSLVGVGRVTAYASAMLGDNLERDAATRLRTLRRDIVSLQDHQKHLDDNVQFLLDATLGFINIQQNNVMKVLTVASVVGIPPTLLAGIWGMNFKNMPELGIPHGYLYAWILIILSGLMPLVWFKRRRWI